MPTATKPKPFTPCPEGEDILFLLLNVEEVINGPDARFNPGGTQWRWNFQTVELTNEDDDPFKLAYFTGTEYLEGNQNCKLTKLLDKICRGWTTEQKEEFDTDTVINKKFRADVVHVKGADGMTRARMENIRRVQPKAQEAIAPKKAAKPDPEDEDEDSDPYADE